MAGTFLSVIIPSYNETENLRRGVLSEVRDYFAKQKYPWEVIVSDDGSPQIEARELARDFCRKNKGFLFLENAHGGKPRALWGGIQKARGEIVLFTDMDQSAPISEVEKLLPGFEEGYDVVIGSRGMERKNFSLLRKIASGVFREVRRAILLPEIIDTQAGFKSLKRAVAREIFPQLETLREEKRDVSGWRVGAWDAELLFVAEKCGYKIKEVPIVWENRDFAMETKKSSSKGKFFRESWEMFQQILRVRVNDLRGYYQKK